MKHLWMLVAGMALVAAGCGDKLTNDDFDAADGNAGFIASEIAAMGLAALEAADSEPVTGAAKVAVFSADTLRDVDVVWTEAAGTWVRTARARYANAVRTRTDTLRFMDAGGALLQRGTVTRGAVDSIYHTRTTDIAGSGGNSYATRLRMGIRIHRALSETTAVKNGTVAGAYNGIELRTVDVSDIAFPRQDGAWRFPQSGSIDIDRPLRAIRILFTGNGTATAEVTNKLKDITRTVLIDVESGAESE